MSGARRLHAQDLKWGDPPVAELLPREHLTDAGAAERFVRLHGDDVRFDYHRRRWLRWQAHRWLIDADAAIVRLALTFVREWQREAVETISDFSARDSTTKYALRLEHGDRLHSMLALARALKPIADAGQTWDRDPWLLGVPNGVVDLRDGALRVGRRDDRITMNTTAPYEPEALCPRWTQFIAEIFADDLELTSFIQRAVGYSLTGITTEQVLFLLFGTGANGKGTFANTLKWALGDYAWNMPFQTIEIRDRAAIPNDLAALVNRRFVVASETNDGTRLNESRVKALTGCDPITARFLHGEFFTFEPAAKFWLSVNHKPVVRDDSFGFWRRLRLVPFLQTFKVNPELADQLRAEAPGILAWCVRGCLAWQRDGLQAPEIVRAATKEYEQDSDPLGVFFTEACEEDEPTAEVSAKDLFNHYKKWAEQHGFSERERLSATAFGRKVSERYRGKHTRDGKVYFGVTTRGM
jgi:putative DNA primase/helicase